MQMNWKSAARWMLRNTVVSSESLTPQFRFRLITENCPLWMSTPDKCPLPDPYWAFYWPGGQAISRFILDNGRDFNNSHILDFGCGCGSISIAATTVGASRVIANDIDPNALIATKLNFRLNKCSDVSVIYTEKNLLDVKNEEYLLKQLDGGKVTYVILGDMFYDSDFAFLIFNWLSRIREKMDFRILVGDPDRHPLVDQQYMTKYKTLFTKKLLAEYPLPGYVMKEHYGFNMSKVYEISVR